MKGASDGATDHDHHEEMKEKPAITIEFSNAAYCFSSIATAKDDEEIGRTERANRTPC